jgi:hypothetical protein
MNVPLCGNQSTNTRAPVGMLIMPERVNDFDTFGIGI